jgi:hypothetical protein
MCSFAVSELGTADFGDKRLNNRVIKMAKDLSRQPEKSIPQIYSSVWGDTKGCYRFFDNEKVSSEKVLKPHQDNTYERVKTYSTVLVIQDTSSVDYSKHNETEGLGYLERKNFQGIKLHTIMAATVEGLPLGLIGQKMWERDNNEYGKKLNRKEKATEDKESYRWIENRNKANALLPEGLRKIHIADRESDIYEFISMPRDKNDDFIIRMYHDRKLMEDGRKIKKKLDESEIRGRYKVEIGRSNRREQRQANLIVKYEKLELRAPVKPYSKLEPTEVTVIYAYEDNAPKNEPPIEWYLITSIEVGNLDQACKCLEYYSKRWLIERFHFILKSGCKIEELQLRTARRLENAIALYSIIAWRLLWMLYFSRLDGKKSYRYVLSKEEMTMLYIHYNPNADSLPKKELTVEDVIRLIARLGGFLNRKSDGTPGIKSLWRGYSIFLEVMYFFEKIKDSPMLNTKLMGNA